MFANRARLLIGYSVVACLATLLTAPSRQGAAAEDLPGWKPFLSTEVFERLLKEEIKTIEDARTVLADNGLSSRRRRAAGGRIRSSALLIAAAAQSYKGKYTANQLAMLRDVALELAEAADHEQFDEAKKHVAWLKRFPKVPADRKAEARPVSFSPRIDMADVMTIFALPLKGGYGIERRLERLPNYRPAVAAKDITPKLELDGYRIALVGRMMRHGLEEGMTRGPQSPLGAADWDQWANYLHEAGLGLARAVHSHDGRKVSERVGDLHATCVSCHNLYGEGPNPAMLATTHSTAHLLAQLRNRNWDARAMARALVRRSAYHGQLDSILSLAESDPDVGVREELRDAVAYYVDRDDVAVLAALLRTFGDALPTYSRSAATYLRRTALRPLVDVPGVQQIFLDADPRVFAWFAGHAGDTRDSPPVRPFGPAPIRLPQLLRERGLKDRDLAVRVTAGAILAQLGTEPKEFMPVIEAGLVAPDAQVRRQAVQAMRRLRPTARSISGLVRSLHDPDPVVRGRAGIALSRAGKAAVPVLMDVLKGDDADARATACFALGRIGPDAREAVPALLTLYKGPDAYQSKLAAFALKKIDPHAVAAGRP